LVILKFILCFFGKNKSISIFFTKIIKI
jgi:hypothetical protein